MKLGTIAVVLPVSVVVEILTLHEEAVYFKTHPFMLLYLVHIATDKHLDSFATRFVINPILNLKMRDTVINTSKEESQMCCAYPLIYIACKLHEQRGQVGRLCRVQEHRPTIGHFLSAEPRHLAHIPVARVNIARYPCL